MSDLYTATYLTAYGSSTPAFPDPAGQLGIRLELSAGGTWTDVTSDCDHGPWTIGRGHPDESTTVAPSTLDATLTNKTARYSPDNVMSDLWPWCVQNMPGRASIPAASNYLRLEADNSDRAFVQDDTALHVTGSLELRWYGRLSDWQGCVLAARYDNTVPSWYLLLNSDGTVTFGWYDSGGTFRSAASDVPLPFLSGDFALKVTLDASVGTLAFYTAAAIDGTYALLGDAFAMTGGAATSVRAGNAPLVIGWSNNLGNPQLHGRVYEFRMLNGIGGTVAADGVFSAQAAGTTSWTDSASNAWSIAGGAEVSDRDYRLHFESSEWPQDEPVYNADKNNDTSVAVDALVPLAGGGLLRRLSQRATNVSSAMYRAILAQAGSLAPVAYWPMEDAANSALFGAAVGGNPMTWTGGPPSLASNSSDFPCSAPLPVTGAAVLQARTPAGSGSGTTWTVRFLAEIGATTPGGSEGVALAQVETSGTCAWVTVFIWSETQLQMTGYASNGSVLFDTGVINFVSFVFDTPLWWSIEAQPSGGNVVYSLVTLAPGAGATLLATATIAGAAGSVVEVLLNSAGFLTDTVIGHLQVQSAWVSLFSLAGALAAHFGEPAGTRFARLCAENGATCRTRGNLNDTIPMGAQPSGTLVSLLQACADADQGIWTELRQVLGWGYVTRKALYKQPATATLDYKQDHLSPWSTAPTRDDQTIVNDATYSNAGGSSARMYAAAGQPITGGRLSTASPASGGVGTYAQSYSVSVASDSQLADLAGWRLHLGTTDQARLPGIVIDLASTDAASIYSQVLNLDLGDRLVISNPPRRLGFEPVTLIVQDIAETLWHDTLTLTITGVPELPYQVWQLSSRIAPNAAVLATGVNATATSWSVKADANDSTQLFSTSPADYPQSWVVDGERVTVTAVSGSSSPQPATVTRSANGVSKSHLAGAAITLWPPPVIGL